MGTILNPGLVLHRTRFGAGKRIKTSTCQCVADGMDGLKKAGESAPKGACREELDNLQPCSYF